MHGYERPYNSFLDNSLAHKKSGLLIQIYWVDVPLTDLIVCSIYGVQYSLYNANMVQTIKDKAPLIISNLTFKSIFLFNINIFCSIYGNKSLYRVRPFLTASKKVIQNRTFG